MLPGECFFVPVATARPGPVAAAGEGVVVLAFVVLDETVVGVNGGQEVARLPAVNARVVLVAVVVDVVVGNVFLISDPLL